MAPNASARSNRRRSKSRRTLQKANGVIAPRVKAAGAEFFAVVCIDPAKMRSEMMMADYMGNLFVEPMTVEHQPAALEAAVQLVKQHVEEQRIKDLIVTIELPLPGLGSVRRRYLKSISNCDYESVIDVT